MPPGGKSNLTLLLTVVWELSKVVMVPGNGFQLLLVTTRNIHGAL